jgi:hypothetical protein
MFNLNYYYYYNNKGAHICGFAAKNYLARFGGKFGKISGLDPAGPGFMRQVASERLDKNDATYVEIFHTNQGFYNTI